MPRRPTVPPDLATRPFTTAEARTAGLTRNHLRSRAWKRVWAGVYVAATVAITTQLTLEAALLSLPFAAVLCGLTAAYLHGLDADPTNPVEALAPPNVGASARYRLRLRRHTLAPEDVTTINDLPVTSLHRTLFDLANQLTTIETVVHIDTALRLGLTTLRALEHDVARRGGQKGVRRYRRAVALADDKAGSPMESRFRLILVSNGLPAPETQVELRDDHSGAFLGRVDFYYPERRLAIEYDGAQHREQLTQDNRRQNDIVNAGYRLLRFSAPDLGQPRRIVETVRSALAA